MDICYILLLPVEIYTDILNKTCTTNIQNGLYQVNKLTNNIINSVIKPQIYKAIDVTHFPKLTDNILKDFTFIKTLALQMKVLKI